MNIMSGLKQDDSAKQVQINLDRINQSIQRTNQLINYQLSLLADTEGKDWFGTAKKQLDSLNRELETTQRKLQEIRVTRKGQPRLGQLIQVNGHQRTGIRLFKEFIL